MAPSFDLHYSTRSTSETQNGNGEQTYDGLILSDRPSLKGVETAPDVDFDKVSTLHDPVLTHSPFRELTGTRTGLIPGEYHGGLRISHARGRMEKDGDGPLAHHASQQTTGSI